MLSVVPIPACLEVRQAVKITKWMAESLKLKARN